MTPPHARSILVCEDDPAMTRIFQFLLRQQGIQNILTTSRGESVLGIVKKTPMDLILLDLMLPGKDGLTVLQELKQNDASRLIPVIVVSGKESQQQVQQAMLAGAIDYVIKPFEPMELGLRIKNFLDSLEEVPPPEPPAAAGSPGAR